jgi:hypothetical protein
MVNEVERADPGADERLAHVPANTADAENGNMGVLKFR